MMSKQTEWPRLALIGGGQMARALIGGWLAGGASAERISVVEPSADQRAWLAEHFPGISLLTEADETIAHATVWVLAVKPQRIAPIARHLSHLIGAPPPLVISILAGIRLADLGRWLGNTRLIRSMPNRPALLGLGATALYADSHITPTDRALASQLLTAVGSVVWVDTEADIDAVTAVSGSGPAYFFLLIELLEAAGVAQGLSPDVARKLAIDTAHGAAALARTSSDDPKTLREQVTSEGGTTAAALAVFKEAKLDQIVAAAVAAATLRAQQLADDFGRDP
jgi:pyrroline-5-carboxylate reductase